MTSEKSVVEGELDYCSRIRRLMRPHRSSHASLQTALRSVLLVALLVVAQSSTADEITCGRLKEGAQFGPFDYRVARPDQLSLVERYHFTPEVEELKRGQSGEYIGKDIDYTLRAFPNHYRALAAMMNLSFAQKKNPPRGARWRVECYFDRAFRFVPNDGATHTIFGIYMMRLGKTAGAIEQFEVAAKLGDDSANLHYNAGLAFFQLGNYDEALAHAKKAYDLGFSLPGLRDMLKKKGKWPAE